MNLEKYRLTDEGAYDYLIKHGWSESDATEYMWEHWEDYGKDMANAQLEAVKPAIEEADAKWVAVLKKYKVTVDSPESLAVSVDVLIEEAKKEERERIYNDLSDFVKMLKSAPEMHGDIQSDIPKTRAFIKYWQALKEGK